jgi:predicted nucleotidyltransferase
VYLVGSLVTGDFDFRSSDVDLIAVTSTDLTDAEISLLETMHADLIHEEPKREGRLEVLYISVVHLKGNQPDYNVAVISPGEPFHVKEIHHDDLIVNWYVLREKGIALFGPEPSTLVDPILHEKIVRVVQAKGRTIPTWFDSSSSLKWQGYIILTLCRSLRLAQTGEFVSKKQAAEWAAVQFSQWAALIEQPLVWRVVGYDPHEDPATIYPETARFMTFMLDQIARY